MPQSTPVDAPIVAVTVFTDGARIRRRGILQLEPGERSLVIDGLPAAIDPASVRVSARGPEVTLADVEVHRRFRTDPLRAEVGRLRADVDACRNAVTVLADEDKAEQAGLTFLAQLSDAAATALARSVGFGRAGYDDLAQMASHLTTDTAGALGRRRDIAARRRPPSASSTPPSSGWRQRKNRRASPSRSPRCRSQCWLPPLPTPRWT